MLNNKKIRQDFPILQSKMNDQSLVYLDNAATSQKPQVVIQAISDYYQQYNSNINRGVYKLAEQATDLYEEARQTVADFIKAKNKEIIFTRNTTESLNLLAYAWGLKNLKKGDEIILTEMEHHSNLVPWQIVAKKTGAILKFIKVNKEGELILGSSLTDLLTDKTKLISLTHISNVLGTINPVADIFKTVKKYNKNIICVLDAAQSLPHLVVDVNDLKADFIAFSSHKLYGPMGIGVLWGKKEILEKMQPFMGGGDMISAVYLETSQYNEIPHKFEAGTPNVAGAIGLKTAIKYLNNIGMNKIKNQENELLKYLWEQLAQFKNLKILGPKELEKRSSLVAFEYRGVHAHDIGQILDHEGVAVRSGHHCAMPLHKKLGVQASTRVSLSFYNTKKDIESFIMGLKKVKKVFSL